MSVAEDLLPGFDREMATTRKVLARPEWQRASGPAQRLPRAKLEGL
jgi:hypothetical protein